MFIFNIQFHSQNQIQFSNRAGELHETLFGCARTMYMGSCTWNLTSSIQKHSIDIVLCKPTQEFMPAQGVAHLYKIHEKWMGLINKEDQGKWKQKSTAVAPSAFPHFKINNTVGKHVLRMNVNEIKNQNINHKRYLLDSKSFLYH